MSFWILFWKIFFILVLAAFALMSVAVTIGGFFDILKLFRKIKEQTDEDEP